MKELSDVSLWIENNFSELKKIVNEKIKLNGLIIDNEKLHTVLPGFPEEDDNIDKLNRNENVIYSFDDNYDSYDFRLSEIKIKCYLGDVKAC